MAKRKVVAVSALVATATMFGAEPASAQDANVEANADVDVNVGDAASIGVDANVSLGIGGGADASADAGVDAGADTGLDAGADAALAADAGAGLDASASAAASISVGGFAAGAAVTFTADDGTVLGTAVADSSGVATLTTTGSISGGVTASGVDSSGNPVSKTAAVTVVAQAARAQRGQPRYAG